MILGPGGIGIKPGELSIPEQNEDSVRLPLSPLLYSFVPVVMGQSLMSLCECLVFQGHMSFQRTGTVLTTKDDFLSVLSSILLTGLGKNFCILAMQGFMGKH